MRPSLQRRLTVAMGIPLLAGLIVASYILVKFYRYEDSASRVMSGDQRTVIQGRIIEARVNGAIELARTSANGEEANQAFHERLVALAEDIRTLEKDHPDHELEAARAGMLELVSAKADPVEDLFVHYRNIKTTSFNLYRTAWVNKWMIVAHSVGLIVNDLDNLPYHAGERAAAGVYAKIAQLGEAIPGAPMPQAAKLGVLGQLNILKSQVTQYGEAIKRSEGMRASRADELKVLATTLRKYNDTQGRAMLQFGSEARTEVFKALIAFLGYILFAFVWWFIAAGRFGAHVDAIAGHISSQFEKWISLSGNITSPGFEAPEKADGELVGAYRAMDQAMKRMNSIRREDILVKRLLNVPFVLINKNRQAIFWNSAMSILGKVRALEETGPVGYQNLLRFTSVQGKVVDPIEKAFVENRDVSQLALLRVADEGLAVQAACTPVQGADHQTEYVMVHIRDLRDENRRAEAELDRQLECVRLAMEFVKDGKVPPEPGPTLRKPVLDTLALLKKHSLELQERAGIMAGQVETMRGRMTREGGLKKTVHGRMEQIRDEIGGVRERLGELLGAAGRAAGKVSQVDGRGKLLKSEYETVRKRALELARDIKQSQTLVSTCLRTLGQTEEVAGRVRSNERMIRGLLEKSAVLNANNSILGSKAELTPTDVVTITENITQLMNQFERSYRIIEQSVEEVDRGLAELSTRLKQSLGACERLTSSDHGISRTLLESEKMVDTNVGEISGFASEVAALQSASQRVGDQIDGVETKIQALCQIGQASVALQSQLELGFEGMFGAVVQAGPSGQAAAKMGGSA